MPTIINRTHCIRSFGGLSLDPGANDVDEAQWAPLASDDYVKALLRKGIISVKRAPVVVEQPAPTDGIPPEDLSELKVGDAIRLVSECTNEDQLRAWLSLDGRKTVREAIVRRVYALAPPAVDDTPDDAA